MELDVNGSAGWLESEELDVLLLPLLVAMQRRLPARSAAPRPSWP